jgi:hypothetical protein
MSRYYVIGYICWLGMHYVMMSSYACHWQPKRTNAHDWLTIMHSAWICQHA